MNPSRHGPTSSAAHDGSALNKAAALKGATVAFQKSTPKPTPRSTPTPSPAVSSRHVDDGALVAAASASRDHSLSKEGGLTRQTTGNSMQDGSQGDDLEYRQHPHSSQHDQQGQGGSAFLLPPGRPTMADPRSPSFIAAMLAASRSRTPSPHHTGQKYHQATPTTRAKRAGSVASSVTSLDLTDSTSVAPTKSLISMFETTVNNTDPVKKDAVSPAQKPKPKPKPKPKLRPTTPPVAPRPDTKQEVSPSRMASSLAWQRASPSPVSMPDPNQRGLHMPQNRGSDASRDKKRPPTPPPARVSRFEVVDDQARAPSNTLPKRKSRAATPPRPVSLAETVILSPQPRRTASRNIIPLEDKIGEEEAEGSSKKRPPVKPKPRARSIQDAPQPTLSNGKPKSPKRPAARPRRSSSTSSKDTFVSASSAQSPGNSSPERGRPGPASPEPQLPPRPSSAQTLPVSRRNPVPPPPRRSQIPISNLPLNSLTNATMAGILASSRATPSSTALTPPPPPSRRQTPHMRQTLRQLPSKSDDEASRPHKHRKKPLGGHKKHSHHEGARRRWREEITARERKRYEGVWASNRGLFLNSSSPDDARTSELVANVVVRDIWARSRLPVDELAEVWDLVDHQHNGALDKADFVVGMWLIDQRLRGRKLPQKVGDSVWESATGVKVPGPRGRKKK